MKLALKALLGIVITLALAAILVMLLVRPAVQAFKTEPELSRQAQNAVDVYVAGGGKAYRRWQSRLQRRDRVLGLLLTGEPSPALVTPLPRRLPSELKKQLQTFLQQQPTFSEKQYVLPDGVKVQSYLVVTDGRSYVWLAVLQPTRADRQTAFVISLVVLGVFLLAAVLLGTWLVVRPLRRLAKANHSFGQGELAARADEKITQRRDEIGELARTFNAAADRVQGLLLQQQQLLHDVSHEIRSPLARMQLAAELLRRADNEEAREERIEQIETAIYSVDQLIDQLLTQARLSSLNAADPAISANMQLIDLHSTILQQVQAWQPTAEQQGVELSLMDDRNDTRAKVMADDTLLQRVMDNVLGNAIKFSDAGQFVTVQVFSTSDDMSIVIADQAGGVSETDLPQLFQPFYRSRANSEMVTNGYGLGLSIAKRAAELMQAELSARNAENGLSVTLRFKR